MIRKISFTILSLFLGLSAMAQDGTSKSSAWSIRPQIGYNLGGMVPVPLPAEIRKINDYKPTGGLSLGADVAYRLDKHWRLNLGLQYFDRGMRTEAEVKSYHMTVNQGGNFLRGYFTGHNHSRAEQRGFGLSFLGEWQPTKRWSFTTGPVVEYYTHRRFIGSVTDGYLRVNVPTGDKVVFGPLADDTPTYDFSEDMSRWGIGWQLGASYRFSRDWSAFASGRYIFTNSFVSTFETISMRLHPTFLTLGLSYQINL